MKTVNTRIGWLKQLRWRGGRGRGQGLVEYAMIISMVIIVVIVMLTFLGDVVFVNYYSKIGSSMDSVLR